MFAENMNKRRGLVAMLLVAVTVVMMVCYMAIEPTPMSTNGRKLEGVEATGVENKMAFKAMKINAKYEIKSAMMTTLRGGSVQERHDTFAALKANIYSGVKDMKHVVLVGLDKSKRRQMESPEDRPAVSANKNAQQLNDEPWTWRSIVGEAGRKLPSVHLVKGAFKAMKGQMKSTFIAFKGPVKATSKYGATYAAKHDSIRDMKQQLKGAILNTRDIVDTDDHDDTAWLHAGENNANAVVSKAEEEAAAATEAAALKAMEKSEAKYSAQQKTDIKADLKKIEAEENLPEKVVSAVSEAVSVAAAKIGAVAATMENTLMGSSKSSKSSKSDKKSEKKSAKKSAKSSKKSSKK